MARLHKLVSNSLFAAFPGSVTHDKDGSTYGWAPTENLRWEAHQDAVKIFLYPVPIYLWLIGQWWWIQELMSLPCVQRLLGRDQPVIQISMSVYGLIVWLTKGQERRVQPAHYALLGRVTEALNVHPAGVMIPLPSGEVALASLLAAK